MKIATFNVNGINARLPRLLEWLEEARPDALCLQELKADGDKFPESAIRDAGYGVVWHGQKGFNGVAILARRRRSRGDAIAGSPAIQDDVHSRYIEARVNGVIIASLYCQTAIPSRARNSITSSPGWSASPPMPPSCSPPNCPWCWPATIMSSPPPPTTTPSPSAPWRTTR